MDLTERALQHLVNQSVPLSYQHYSPLLTPYAFFDGFRSSESHQCYV